MKVWRNKMRTFNGVYGEEVLLANFWEYLKSVLENSKYTEIWLKFQSRPECLEEGEQDIFGEVDLEFGEAEFKDGKVWGYVNGVYCNFDEDCLFYDKDGLVIGYAEPKEISEI